ncbi:ABC-three component system middle component 1 [Paenibacillus sp. FSL E2-0274]|uniref:ABC-three component system middle component 1 n=1 Tax=Paenibacillus TaxID=44249 RepID=UPI00096EE1A1|nr:ABC-three component system middle component 1 [Paenibacillus odorifer]OMD12604.1 hypothetical protein BJP47_05130 [Paenibacillus odorifer]OME36249.1 hypothetical protein BSK63_03870 [Paenibacillus odorifer]
MRERLFEYFNSLKGLEKLTDLKIRHVDELYFSAEQIFGVSCYDSQLQMENYWERAAYQFAYRIQNQMPRELDDLRWDMYLVLYIDEPIVNHAFKKRIETNQFFFRKIVITQADLGRLAEKLPLGFNNPAVEKGSERIWFEDHHFLMQWQSCVEISTRENLDQALFHGNVDSVESLIQALNLPELSEVLGDED